MNSEICSTSVPTDNRIDAEEIVLIGDARKLLQKLAAISSCRLYVPLLNVRDFSVIRQVMHFLDKLPGEFKVFALDTFLKMARRMWAFAESFADYVGTQRYPMDYPGKTV